MPRASAHDSGTVGSSTAQRAKPGVSGKAYSVSEMFADGLGNGSCCCECSAKSKQQESPPLGSR